MVRKCTAVWIQSQNSPDPGKFKATNAYMGQMAEGGHRLLIKCVPGAANRMWIEARVCPVCETWIPGAANPDIGQSLPTGMPCGLPASRGICARSVSSNGW